MDYNSIEVYPNPTSGILYVNIEKTFDAIIYNYQGQIVDKINDNVSQIDMSGFEHGIYFVEIRTDADVFVKKVLVK